MNWIWILLLLCLCNGNGSWGNSDGEDHCPERRNGWRNDRESWGDNRGRRDDDKDCGCREMGRDTCNMERDDRREDRRDDRREDRRFPKPPFAPETGCCCEASEDSDRSEELL